MAATTNSLFHTHQYRIEEVINKNVDVILPGLDPVWRNTVVTSQGVGPIDAIGRDMHILRVFQGGMTGVLEQARPRDDFVLYGDDQDTDFGNRLHTQGVSNTFPDPTEGPNQSPYRLGIPMRAMVANIMFTLGELTAEAHPAFIGQILAPKLEGFSRNIAHTLCNYFYLSQNSYYQLCLVSAASTSGSGPYYLTFEPDNQACDRFYVGQRLDIYTSNDPSERRNESGGARQKVFVDYVDELKNEVRLVSNVDAFSSVVNNDIVVYANSNAGDTAGTGGSGSASDHEYTGIAGINSWLKTGSGGNDNYLLGGERVSADPIDVTTYPEHKSMGYSLGSTALTEHKLRQILRRFHAAKNKYGYYVDTVIASDGVWLAYEGTRIGREMLDRTGRVASLTSQGLQSDENFGGFKFTMDGRSYMGQTSTYVESGTMYGIRTGGNNWKRYVPPDIKNTRTFDRAPSFLPFRFVASSITGLASSQLPVYSASSGDAGAINLVTEASQMPGWLRMQLVPDQFCGIKLTNIAEDRIYADN